MGGWYSRGYLPHFHAAEMVQHITFHLVDSLPRQAVERMRADLDGLPAEERAHSLRQRIQDLLDAGAGSCVLRRVDCASLVQDSLLFGDGSHYRLLAWTIMPNHVHVMIQTGDRPLARIVQSWKRHTARAIHRLLGCGDGPLWQRDYWDRFIRDDAHFLAAKRYIEANPVKAGLVRDPNEWPWCHLAIIRRTVE